MQRRLTHSRPKHKQRGMAMAGTMMILLFLMTVALLGMAGGLNSQGHSGVMSDVDNSYRSANARMLSVGSFNMAEAGVDYTLQWLNGLSSPPPNTAAFGPQYIWGSFAANTTRTTMTPDPTSPGNTFAVMVYPDSSNSGNQQKKYLIESVGTSGGVSEVVQAYVQVSSLSKWLVLVNQWPTGNYWVSGLSTFDGPVHDNNANGINENVWWMSNAPSPMWTYSGSDAYEVSGNVNWYKDNYYTLGTPQTAAQWQTVLAGGAGTFTSGAAPIPFPTTSSIQRNAALGLAAGATAVIPVSTGVTVTPGGGIYIHCAQSQSGATPPTPNNDVQQMVLSVDGSGNQVITVTQNDDNGNPMTTTVTMNVAANATQMTVNSLVPNGNSGTFHSQTTTSSVPGLTNGVVYCDGNIGAQGTAPGDPLNGTAKTGGLSGVIADNTLSNGQLTHRSGLTLTTDASKNTNIDGNIIYNTARAKDANGNYLPESEDPNFMTKAGTFGLVSNTVLITTTDASGNPLNNVEVDGATLAYSLFEVDKYTTRPPGNWENMGGYLSANMGYFGVFNGNGTLASGMNNFFNYDARFKNTPPPYFPTTGNNYDILSWRRVVSTLQ